MIKATLTFEFSTVAEATDFYRTVQRARSSTSVRKSRMSADAHQLLEIISNHPHGLMSDDFARAIGSTTQNVAPRMMLLYKGLRSIGLLPCEVILRKRFYVKGRAKSLFTAGPRLRDAIDAISTAH